MLTIKRAPDKSALKGYFFSYHGFVLNTVID